MISGFRRVVKAGFVGFWRNAYVSLAAIFVLTIALFVVGMTLFLDHLLNTSLLALQSKVDLNIHFVPDAPQEEVDSVRASVEALPDVTLVTYTSREDALARYRADNQNNEIALQALNELDDNPLGASMAIQARDTSQYEGIARFIEELESPYIYNIDEFYEEEKQEGIDAFTRFIEAAEKSSYLIMGVLVLAASLITFNTIRLAIYTSREEIAIMRLVGAGNMFIRGPFMLQGIMYGVLAGLLSMALLYPIMVWIGPYSESFFGINLFTYYVQNFGNIFGILVSIGVVLGLVSSTFAVARYLRT